MSNRKKIRLKRRDKNRPRPSRHIILTEENKNEVSEVLGYPIETVNKVLAEARSEGYEKVSIPLPPGT